LPASGAGPPEPVRPRLTSVDAFRGATVAAMILVNSPGGAATYGPLEHAEWHGFTPTDLIFPFFLFLVGVSLPFSTRDTTGAAAWRAGKIFGLGFLIAFYPRFDLSTVRIPGVLPRIAVCYFAAFLAKKTLRPVGIAVLAALLLAAGWALLTLVPVPDGHPPNLEPETHLGAWVDRAVFGPHLWARSKTWDPEGLLSTVPAIATTLLGVLAGFLLASRLPTVRKAGILALAGAVLTGAGLAWGTWGALPINKNLWTSSYALFTGGLAALFLAAFYLVTDGWGWKRWAKPFVVYGVNAILVFVGSGFLAKTLLLIKVPQDPPDGSRVSLQAFLYQHLYAPWLSPENASLAYALTHVLGWYLVLAWLDRRGLHWKV
jgi:predicted acyltransferase